MFDFKDRTVIITGAAGNLGVAAARAFLHANANLALVDRSPDRLGALIPELVNTPWFALVGAVDLMDPASVERAVQGILQQFGRIDVLVNTVGGYRGGQSVQDTPLDDWEFLFNLNLHTVLNACRAVIPHMKSQGSGKIINVAARSANAGAKNLSAYSASKSAVLRLTESLSAELKDSGINVNCILPATIDTPQNREAAPGADFARWTSPDAIGDVILFLASDYARAVHGAGIPV
jgi:NAD(P)-dependent dehydrogenase (short-subunit alcohol dehydrogenase family)